MDEEKKKKENESENGSSSGSQTPVSQGGLGTLYICGTPIGNLEDITLRALATLKEVDFIAAEDTRQTRKLLARYDINTPLVSYHEHNMKEKGPEIVDELRSGKKVALVSDAGMPGISDPGFDLVRRAIEAGIRVVPVPGPTAFVAALVASGLPTDTFVFLGFLPRKGKDRKALLDCLAVERRTSIVYEAPHRIRRTLQELRDRLGPGRGIAVARELTKVHEEILRGTLGDLDSLMEMPGLANPRGEFVIIIGPPTIGPPTGLVEGTPGGRMNAGPGYEGGGNHEGCGNIEGALDRVKQLVDSGMERKSAVKLVSRETGFRRRELYRLSLKK
ncbi:MAG TPA: 16S rRNA (cytidine(1402)-2'-O)-methyltransferase [Firmicutes bacterium]|nr:16S rRNA (cytidine(1402)-2'-O)-methyltransferase [Bacillota bacterium]